MVLVRVELQAPLSLPPDEKTVELQIDDVDNGGIGVDGQEEMLCFQLYSLLDLPPQFLTLSYRSAAGVAIVASSSRKFAEGDVVVVDLAKKLPWRSQCSRIFSLPDQAFVQPSFFSTATSNGGRVCAGCASTCHPPPTVTMTTSSSNNTPFVCGCSSMGDCLFQARICSEVVPRPHLQSVLRQACDAQRYANNDTNMAHRTQGETSMIKRLHSYLQQVQQYENPELQRQVRDTIVPHARLWQAVSETAAVHTHSYPAHTLNASEERALLQALLDWFKQDHFTWVNNPPCRACGNKDTVSLGRALPPTPEDTRYGAGRVEGYRCPACEVVTRFPRYNSARRLLFDAPRGRCGEWANAFTLVCRSVGYPTRFVVDWTDHVWTEVWLTHERRWCHLDSCEASLDSPLLYEAGWGKRLTYALAFDGRERIVTDVIRRYTRTWYDGLASRRTAVSEDFLEGLVRYLNAVGGRSSSSGSAEAGERAQLERAEIAHWKRDALEINDRKVTAEEAHGRQSGDIGWRKARGELGDNLDHDHDATPVTTDNAETPTVVRNEPAEKSSTVEEATEVEVKSETTSSPSKEERVSRLVRVYFTQLTQGCGANGSSACKNNDLCGTFAGNPNKAAGTALQLAMAEDRSRLCSSAETATD